MGASKLLCSQARAILARTGEWAQNKLEVLIAGAPSAHRVERPQRSRMLVAADTRMRAVGLCNQMLQLT